MGLEKKQYYKPSLKLENIYTSGTGASSISYNYMNWVWYNRSIAILQHHNIKVCTNPDKGKWKLHKTYIHTYKLVTKVWKCLSYYNAISQQLLYVTTKI